MANRKDEPEDSHFAPMNFFPLPALPSELLQKVAEALPDRDVLALSETSLGMAEDTQTIRDRSLQHSVLQTLASVAGTESSGVDINSTYGTFLVQNESKIPWFGDDALVTLFKVLYPQSTICFQARYWGLGQTLKLPDCRFQGNLASVSSHLSVKGCVLTWLDLASNKIDDAGSIALANALEINATLISLDLGNNWISTGGVTALATALTVNTTLIALGLGKSRLDTKGATALAEVVATRSVNGEGVLVKWLGNQFDVLVDSKITEIKSGGGGFPPTP